MAGRAPARYNPHMTTGSPHDRSGPSTALLTDHYELSALDAVLASGIDDHRAVFELFGRGLPPGRRYGVVAGQARAMDAVARFRFGDEELEFLEARGFLASTTLAWLADYRFSGTIDGYRDGELYFPGSPMLTVEGPFAEALILETVLLSVLNHDVAVASAGARMVDAAGGRTLIEGGARRTHEEAAVAAALAAAIVGVEVTSNLEAGRRHGLRTAGTTMHAFTLAFPDERAAFDAQAASFTGPTTYLVDTYDVEQGIRNAVAAGGTGIGAVRIDSGDLGREAARARRLLDQLGATGCEIVVSGDLDEHRIAALAAAPIDRYLLGTRLVTGSGAPTGELVYKLVAIAAGGGPDAALAPVEKTSPGKESHGGRKVAARELDPSGHAVAERVWRLGEGDPDVAGGRTLRPLQVPLWRDGRPVPAPDLEATRDHHRRAMDELWAVHRQLLAGPPAFDGTPTGAESRA